MTFHAQGIPIPYPCIKDSQEIMHTRIGRDDKSQCTQVFHVITGNILKGSVVIWKSKMWFFLGCTYATLLANNGL